MLRKILIIISIYIFGVVINSNAQEKQCWLGYVEVEYKLQYEDIKKKEGKWGHEVSTNKVNKHIYLKVDFYTETGKKAQILWQEVSGSSDGLLKIEEHHNYATCLKRVEPNKPKREVQVSPGSSTHKELRDTAKLSDDNFKFDIHISMDTKTNIYYIEDFYFSGLKWKGVHEQKRKYTFVDRRTCKRETFEQPFSQNMDYGDVHFGGSYRGYAGDVNKIKGSKTTKCPTAELCPDVICKEAEENCAATFPWFETTYRWEAERVVCDFCKIHKLFCEKTAAEALKTCEEVLSPRCYLRENPSEIKKCLEEIKADCVREEYNDSLRFCMDLYKGCR